MVYELKNNGLEPCGLSLSLGIRTSGMWTSQEYSIGLSLFSVLIVLVRGATTLLKLEGSMASAVRGSASPPEAAALSTNEMKFLL